MFIVSSVTPMTIGINVETTNVDVELEEMLDNLRFFCTTPDGINDVKYEYYKEQLLSQYSSMSSNDDIVVEPKNEEVKIPTIPSLSPLSSSGPMDSAWPMAYHDTHHTGRSPYSTANNPYDEKWRFECSWVQDTPVIDSDGTIYVGGGYQQLNRYLIAIHPDGTLKWRFKTGGLILGSSPAIDSDGTIYIGSWDTKLYAINPDGSEKWRVGIGGSIASSPIIAEDGTIYVGTLSSGNSIVAVNPNGTIKWSYPTGFSVTSDPCISDDGTIYAGSQDTYFYAMNPDGTLKWRFKTGDWIQGHPSIATDGTIYIGSFDDYLYALYPNGTMKWKYGAGTETNPSIADDGTIYIGYEKLYAINPNGTSKWSFDPGADSRIVSSSPAISAEGTIYFGTNIGETAGGDIIAVNPDGIEKWRKRIANKWVDSSPSIAEDGTVYIGCAYEMSRGYLHAFGNVESNSPPGAPSITGPTQAKAGEKHWYTFVAHDPDNHPIQLFVDWDDGNSGWVDWFASGETMWAEHAWASQGAYTIRAKVRDDFGGESDWGYLDVTMPRNRVFTNSPVLRFLCHPIIFQLLQQFLNL